MCLDLKRFSFIKTAYKDIVVYKFIEPKKDYYITPYRKFPVNIGETYTSKLERTGSFFKESEVDKGLHSFKNKKDAEEYASLYGSKVVECIIPKGSKYYKGTFTCGKNISYASNKLKYVKIVENENNK